jgi:hypothetical protein
MARYSSALGSLLIVSALSAQQVTVVDVEAVRATGDPSTALRIFTLPANPAEISCDILVAGAGMGGVAAALTASKRGHSVCLTEESTWIGGQMTAGGVSALDEHKFIEITGATRTYSEMRNRLREYYRHRFQLKPAANLENLNPGACYVSSLCFEPRAGVSVLEDMLRPHPSIRVMPRTKIFHLDQNAGRIQSALAYRFDSKDVVRIRPRFVLDATELGDLLPLAKVPYVAGSEPKSDTNEPHAAIAPNPECVQSFTYPFILEHSSGESHSIPKPPEYEKFRDHQPFSMRFNYPKEFGWRGEFQYSVFGEDPPIPNNMSPRPFFPWRRVLAAKNFRNVPNDLALINWPRQDYHSESVIDRTPQDTARVLQQAKRVSLAFLYWLQHDVPRDDGKGSGYPQLKLRLDAMGSEDGLSQYPYIRESRRIRSKIRVIEQDIVSDYQPGPRARWFADSVGTGFYMVDIHPCGANERGRMMMPRPFQIPMGAIQPTSGPSNFLPAAKSLGVTHLTNGAFRLHPVEWNIGEAAATMASLSLSSTLTTSALQRELAQAGVPLVWFDDLPSWDPNFAAVQLAAIRGLYPLDSSGLHASPNAPITRREAARALAAFFGKTTDDPVKLAVAEGWMAVDHRNWVHEDLPLYWTDIRATLPPFEMKHTGPVTRAEWARRFATALQ